MVGVLITIVLACLVSALLTARYVHRSCARRHAAQTAMWLQPMLEQYVAGAANWPINQRSVAKVAAACALLALLKEEDAQHVDE